MINSKLLGIGFMCAMALTLSAEAKLYKWVDDKGTTHYGEVIPPEYANKDRETLNKSGLLEKQAEKIQPKAGHVDTIEEQAIIEEKRRNSTLLSTYSNVKEIDMAQERSLVLVKARIESNAMLLKSTQSSLDDLNKEAETRTKSGKKIPQSLTKDIEQTQARSDKYAAELAKSKAEYAEVNARFEQDKALYSQLKGVPASK